MPEHYEKKIDSREFIEQMIEKVRDDTLRNENIHLRYNRPENKEFMNRYNYHKCDVIDCLRVLRIEDYSHTSVEEGKADAYVFGPKCPDIDVPVYLKIQILNEKDIILSFHEDKYGLKFYYRSL